MGKREPRGGSRWNGAGGRAGILTAVRRVEDRARLALRHPGLVAIPRRNWVVLIEMSYTLTQPLSH